jgi:hypothetical protein
MSTDAPARCPRHPGQNALTCIECQREKLDPSRSPPPEFPAGCYAMVAGDRLEAETADGARLVRVLRGSTAPLFLVRREGDRPLQQLEARIENLTEESGRWRSDYFRSQYELEDERRLRRHAEANAELLRADLKDRRNDAESVRRRLQRVIRQQQQREWDPKTLRRAAAWLVRSVDEEALPGSEEWHEWYGWAKEAAEGLQAIAAEHDDESDKDE